MAGYDTSFAPAGTLIKVEEERIQEVINEMMDFYLRTIDPLTDQMSTTARDVSPAGIGRDMRVLKTYHSGMSGVIESGAGRSDPTIFGEQGASLDSRLFKYDAVGSSTQLFPKSLNSPRPFAYKLGFSIKSQLVSLPMSIGDLVLDGLPATVGEHISRIITGFARNLAWNRALPWWLDQSKSRRICKITNFTSIDTKTFTFQPDNEATGRFEVGQMIDIWDSGMAARANDTAAANSQTNETMIPLYVTSVDVYSNTVRCHSPTAYGSWTGDSSPGNGDYVLPANAVQWQSGATAEVPKLFNGFYSWAKPGGTATNDKYLLGSDYDSNNAVDVDLHTEHKSLFYDNGGDPMTEDILSQLLHRFHAHNEPLGHTIEMLAAPSGVWHAYWQQQFLRFREDRTGRPGNLENEGRRGEFSITVDGKTYRGLSSDWMESGEMIGLKLANNWTRYVPPAHPGAGSLSGEAVPGLPFQWLTRLLTGTDRAPITLYTDTAGGSSGTTETRYTQFWQQFGDVRMEIAPEQAAAMVIRNCDDQRLYSNV